MLKDTISRKNKDVTMGGTANLSSFLMDRYDFSVLQLFRIGITFPIIRTRQVIKYLRLYKLHTVVGNLVQH